MLVQNSKGKTTESHFGGDRPSPSFQVFPRSLLNGVANRCLLFSFVKLLQPCHGNRFYAIAVSLVMVSSG